MSVQDFLFCASPTALDDSLEWSDATPDQRMEAMRKWRRISQLGNAHNMAQHTRKTPTRIKRFCHLTGGILLRRDNASCWNACNNLLESLLRHEVRHAIEIYIDENPAWEAD